MKVTLNQIEIVQALSDYLKKHQSIDLAKKAINVEFEINKEGFQEVNIDILDSNEQESQTE